MRGIGLVLVASIVVAAVVRRRNRAAYVYGERLADFIVSPRP